MERRLSDVIKGCVLPSLRKQQNTNVPETCCWWNGIEMFVVWTWSELHPRRVTHVHSWCSVYYSCYLIIRWITVYQSLLLLHFPESLWTACMFHPALGQKSWDEWRRMIGTDSQNNNRTSDRRADGRRTVMVWIALRWCHQTIWAVNAGGFKNDTIDHSQ